MDRRTNVALTVATFAIIMVWAVVAGIFAVPDLWFWVGGVCITAVVWVAGKIWDSRGKQGSATVALSES